MLPVDGPPDAPACRPLLAAGHPSRFCWPAGGVVQISASRLPCKYHYSFCNNVLQLVEWIGVVNLTPDFSSLSLGALSPLILDRGVIF